MGAEPTAAKQVHRKVWAAGDWADVARLHAEPGRVLVSRIGIEPGWDALDVATGTGSTAILVAKAGARTVGLDITPKLLALAERRARSESVDIEWREGDAEDLPFPDDQFDLVLSSFGVGWAPNQERAAQELVRVLKTGGTLGLCHWSATGNQGRYLQVVSHYLPPSTNPSRAWLWGDEDHLRHLFADARISFEFDRATTSWEFESLESMMAYWETKDPSHSWYMRSPSSNHEEHGTTH